MRHLSFLLLVTFMFACKEAGAQINILYQPQIYNRSVEGLGVFQVQNFYTDPYCIIRPAYYTFLFRLSPF